MRTYGVEEWTDHIDFLTKFAKDRGKLLKGGDADVSSVAKCMAFLFLSITALIISVSFFVK